MTFAGEAFAFDGLVLTPVGQSPSWDPEPAPGSTRVKPRSYDDCRRRNAGMSSSHYPTPLTGSADVRLHDELASRGHLHRLRRRWFPPPDDRSSAGAGVARLRNNPVADWNNDRATDSPDGCVTARSRRTHSRTGWTIVSAAERYPARARPVTEWRTRRQTSAAVAAVRAAAVPDPRRVLPERASDRE